MENKIYKKYLDKIGKYLFKTLILILIIVMIYETGLFVTALYLGDLEKAEKIVESYSIFKKAVITLLSGFFIIWFGGIIKYLFSTFILEKHE